MNKSGVADARSCLSHRQDNSSTALLTPPVAPGPIVGLMRANNNTQRALAALSAIAASIALVISTAPTAHADEHDDAFIRALRSDGIVSRGDPAAVVAWAHWACDQLNQGANKEYVVAWLSQYNPNAPNGTFLRKAALYYCPEHNNKLAGW
jgi:hypothetical protein